MFELWKENRQQALLYAIVLAFILLGAVVHSVFTIMALLVAAFTVSLFGTSAFPLIFFLYPFANIFKLSSGSTSLYTMLCIFFVLVYFVKNRSISKNVLFVLLIFTTYLVVTDWNTFGALNIGVKLAVGILLIYIYCKSTNVEMITYSALYGADGLILSVVLSCNVWFYEKVLPFMRVVYYKHGSNVLRNSGLFTDPNYSSMAIIMFLVFLIVLYDAKLTKFGFWIRAALLISLGMLSYSKSFIIALVFVVLYATFFVFIQKKSPTFFVMMIVITIGVNLALNGKIEAFNRVMERFNSSEYDLTSGRIEKNIFYLSYILNDIKVLLIGTGVTIDRIPGYNNVHNFLLEIVQRIGLIGTTLYMGAICTCSPRLKIQVKRKWVHFFPIVCLTIEYMALAGLTAYEFPIYVMICYAAFELPALLKWKGMKENEKI